MNTSAHLQQIFEAFGVIISSEIAESILVRTSQPLKRMIHFSCAQKNTEQFGSIWKSVTHTLTGMQPPTTQSSIEYNAVFFDCFFTEMNNIHPSNNWMLKPVKAETAGAMN